MITINLICVGNLKEKFWRDAEDEYKKRLSKFCKLNITEIEEKNNESTIELTLQKEEKDILAKAKGYKILMDIHGKQKSSKELANFVEKISLKNSEITFIIGSSNGVGQKVKDSADELVSFGPNTFPHNLARIMLLEQIYRLFCINNNIKYHK